MSKKRKTKQTSISLKPRAARLLQSYCDFRMPQSVSVALSEVVLSWLHGEGHFNKGKRVIIASRDQTRGRDALHQYGDRKLYRIYLEELSPALKELREMAKQRGETVSGTAADIVTAYLSGLGNGTEGAA